jgi:hypothetical protein
LVAASQLSIEMWRSQAVVEALESRRRRAAAGRDQQPVGEHRGRSQGGSRLEDLEDLAVREGSPPVK